MINIFITKKIKKLTKELVRVKTFREYEKIHRVTLLFDIEDLTSVETLVQTLNSEGKDVTAYSFDSKNQSIPQLPETFNIWNKSNLDFWGIPKEADFKIFKGREADTLIDLTKKTSPIMRYLFLNSSADFRVGFNHDNALLYDLLIERNEAQEFSFFVNQMLFYMKSLRTK